MYNGTIDLSQLSDFSTSALEKNRLLFEVNRGVGRKGGEKGAVAAVATASFFDGCGKGKMKMGLTSMKIP